MQNYEIFTRLAEIRASAQSELEKCSQAFLLVATFLQNSGNVAVPAEFKQRLRRLVDEFYCSAQKEKSAQ